MREGRGTRRGECEVSQGVKRKKEGDRVGSEGGKEWKRSDGDGEGKGDAMRALRMRGGQ